MLRTISPRVRTLIYLQLFASAVYAAIAISHVGMNTGWWYDSYFNFVMLFGAAVCFAGARASRDERLAWICFGMSFVVWVGGSFAYRIMYAGGPPPVPSVPDVLYLSLFPFAYAGVILLLRARVRDFRSSMWLDGLIAALGAGALSAALMLDVAISGGFSGRPAAEVITNLAYPVGDLILMALVAAAVAITGVRGGAAWGLIALGLILFSVSDSLFLINFETYQIGTALDLGWGLAPAVIGLAAFAKKPKTRAKVDSGGVTIPLAFGLIGAGILLWNHFERANTVAVTLAALCVLATLARVWLTNRENRSLLRRMRSHADTDALTGLGNRRRLVNDLDELLAQDDRPPAVLMMMDLNGFKAYNDSFGHPAGDQLLTRLGARLATAVGNPAAYRMGGDEFCVLLTGEIDVTTAEGQVCEALSERGEGFDITCAFGTVVIGNEDSGADVLGLADQRMYGQKRSSRVDGRRQSADALMAAMRARYPETYARSRHVAELARDLALETGMTQSEAERVALVGELHDIGKIAIPESILAKPGALEEEEWDYVKRHSMIGAHIVLRSPGLEPLAPLIEATHERVDGSGYPHGLPGDEIPAEAKIVAICNSFDAMTHDRPFAAARSVESALEEIERNAGKQFDRALVPALRAVITARSSSLAA